MSSTPPAAHVLSATQLEDLLERHGALIYRMAVAIVHDHALAEDVVQEVVLKAWRSLPDEGGDVPVRWLRTVTRNTSIDLLRHRRFDSNIHRPPDHLTTDLTTDRIVEGRHHLHALWLALSHLDQDSRTMLVLRETEGFSYEEIAELLTMTPSAVKAKLYRARHTLRQRLQDWD